MESSEYEHEVNNDNSRQSKYIIQNHIFRRRKHQCKTNTRKPEKVNCKCKWFDQFY